LGRGLERLVNAAADIARATLQAVAAEPSAIEINDLTMGYDGHPAVHHLDGKFAKGSLTAIVGPNGSGKSTLLKGIMGQLVPLGGSVRINAASVAYLPQLAEIDRNFPARVADLVGLGLWAKRGPYGGYAFADRAAVSKALSTVGLEGFARRSIDTLSGGQMQRALFARLLLQDAQVVLLDEPFTAIDEQSVSDLMALIARWQGEGRTVIAVLHDLELVRRGFPQTLLLAREPIGWGATADVLTEVNLTRARAMPEAWDVHAPWHSEPDHAHEAHP
jgi:zinc/manganese transport system ATP-binding protein